MKNIKKLFLTIFVFIFISNCDSGAPATPSRGGIIENNDIDIITETLTSESITIDPINIENAIHNGTVNVKDSDNNEKINLNTINTMIQNTIFSALQTSPITGVMGDKKEDIEVTSIIADKNNATTTLTLKSLSDYTFEGGSPEKNIDINIYSDNDIILEIIDDSDINIITETLTSESITIDQINIENALHNGNVDIENTSGGIVYLSTVNTMVYNVISSALQTSPITGVERIGVASSVANGDNITSTLKLISSSEYVFSNGDTEKDIEISINNKSTAIIINNKSINITTSGSTSMDQIIIQNTTHNNNGNGGVGIHNGGNSVNTPIINTMVRNAISSALQTSPITGVASIEVTSVANGANYNEATLKLKTSSSSRYIFEDGSSEKSITINLIINPVQFTPGDKLYRTIGDNTKMSFSDNNNNRFFVMRNGYPYNTSDGSDGILGPDSISMHSANNVYPVRKSLVQDSFELYFNNYYNGYSGNHHLHNEPYAIGIDFVHFVHDSYTTRSDLSSDDKRRHANFNMEIRTKPGYILRPDHPNSFNIWIFLDDGSEVVFVDE